jgi:integrase
LPTEAAQVIRADVGQPIIQLSSKTLKTTLLRACIKDFRWHDLRHIWASWQRQNGTQLDELQKLGGWMSESMVRRYAHLSSEDISQASMRIDAAFDKLNLPKSS